MRHLPLLLAVITASFPAFVGRAEPFMPPTISTSGESTVFVVPDEVEVSLGVETFDADLDKSKQQNDEQSTKLLKAIKALGVEEKHIQTDTLNLEIRYRSGNRPFNGIEGYLARRAYTITLKDTKLFEKLTDTALKNGANQLMGFEFRTKGLRTYRDRARTMAIKAAKEKAVDLAAALDAKVGLPRTINEGGNGGIYYGGSRRSFGNSFSNSVGQNSEQVMGGSGNEGGETLPLGQIAVRASVSVTFDLLP